MLPHPGIAARVPRESLSSEVRERERESVRVCPWVSWWEVSELFRWKLEWSRLASMQTQLRKELPKRATLRSGASIQTQLKTGTPRPRVDPRTTVPRAHPDLDLTRAKREIYVCFFRVGTLTRGRGLLGGYSERIRHTHDPEASGHKAKTWESLSHLVRAGSDRVSSAPHTPIRKRGVLSRLVAPPRVVGALLVSARARDPSSRKHSDGRLFWKQV